MKLSLRTFGWLVLAGLALTACGQGTVTQPLAATPVQAADAGLVIAEATLEPVQWIALRSATGGTVAAVLVAEGERVAAGQLLVRLDDRDAQIAVQQASAAVAAAEAQRAELRAGARPADIAAAEAQIKVAQAGLTQAVAQRDALQSNTQSTRAVAAAQVAAAEADAWEAKNIYDHYGWQLGDGATKQWQAAEAALDAAEAEQVQAQAGGTAQVRAANAAVSAAAAEQALAEAQLNRLQARASPEQLAAAKATCQQAQAALAAARLALERTELRAPFAGTVTQLAVKPGELAGPGEVVLVLATVEQLQAVTTDLTELAVARVQLGQPVTLTVDALPEREFQGRVVAMDQQAVEYRGDMTYPVTIALEGDTTGLRWGMTAVVKIAAP